jgi:hypothetical protein
MINVLATPRFIAPPAEPEQPEVVVTHTRTRLEALFAAG